MTEPEPSLLRLAAGGAEAVFDLANGARLASLVVDGNELLVQRDHDPMRWGSYPMVPWAGRVRHGRFEFGGRRYRLPVDLPPHAIHGTAYTSAWTDQGGVMRLALTDPWPFGGIVEQEATLAGDRLAVTLTLTAGEVVMPAMLGWHPWFRRRLGSVEAALEIYPSSMYELDHEMIPTGRLVEPGPPPWDNCFILAQPPRIRWPGLLEIELTSTCPCWTVFTEPEHALCVEPQTDAPDSFNREPDVVQPGEALTATFELHWRRPA